MCYLSANHPAASDQLAYCSSTKLNTPCSSIHHCTLNISVDFSACRWQINDLLFLLLHHLQNCDDLSSWRFKYLTMVATGVTQPKKATSADSCKEDYQLFSKGSTPPLAWLLEENAAYLHKFFEDKEFRKTWLDIFQGRKTRELSSRSVRIREDITKGKEKSLQVCH